jgi:hypothetical protein
VVELAHEGCFADERGLRAGHTRAHRGWLPARMHASRAAGQ